MITHKPIGLLTWLRSNHEFVNSSSLFGHLLLACSYEESYYGVSARALVVQAMVSDWDAPGV